MKNSRTLLILVLTLWLVVTASGQTPAPIYDGFGTSFPIYANGGNGFAGPWAQGGFNAFASGYRVNDRSLCYPRLKKTGGSISGEAFSAINGAVRDLAQPLETINPTVYLSFLIQPQGTLNDGVFNGFFGLTLNGSLGSDLFIGKPGGGAVEQYVLEDRGGTGQVASGTPTVVGRTALLVLKAQFGQGNEVFTLYVNPTPGGPEPNSGTMKSDLDLGSVTKIGIYSTGAFAVDEIRIGTSYASVLPVRNGKPEDQSAGCLEQPE
jgi:hypothetical protein